MPRPANSYRNGEDSEAEAREEDRPARRCPGCGEPSCPSLGAVPGAWSDDATRCPAYPGGARDDGLEYPEYREP
jgi:hypothetical protein